MTTTTRYSLLLTCMMIFGTWSVQAQKARVSDETIEFSYMRLPIHSDKDDLTTYSTAIIADPAVGLLGVNAAGHEDKLVFHGKKKIKSGGHFLIEVRVGGPQVSSRKVDKITKTRENKEGKKITTTTYKPSCSLALASISYKLVDYENNYLIDEIQSASTSRLTPSEKSSESSANKDLDAAIRSAIHNHISEAMRRISNHISAQYGYQTIHLKEKLYAMKSEKHPEYLKFQKAFKGVEKTLSSLQPGVDLAAVTQQVQPHLAYWDNLAKGISSDDKKAAKLKFACLYNIAQTNLWLAELDEANNYLAKLDALDKKDFLVSQLKKTHEGLSTMVKRYPKKGLYYDYQLQDATPPTSVSYAYEASTVADMLNTASIPKSSNQLIKRGQIRYLGQTQEAAFVLPINEIDGSPQDFQPKNGFKIYTHNGSDFEQLERVQVDLRAGDYFIVDDIKYKFLKSKGTYWDIMEIYYESDKIKCYALNSMDKKPLIPKLRIKKNGVDAWKPNMLSEDVSIKSLKTYLEDCPEAAEYLANNEDDNTAQLFKKIGEHYTTKCN